MGLVRDLLTAYIAVFIVRGILSFFPVHRGSWLADLERLCVVVTEPLVYPVRRLIPPLRAGTVGLDLSLTIVVIVLYIIRSLI